MVGQRSILAGLVAVSLAAVAAFPLFTAFSLAPSFSHLIVEGAQKEAERTAAHLAEPFFDATGLIRAEQVTPEFRATVARHLRQFGLEKLKVFAPSGEIVFSSDQAEEGMVNAKPYFHEVVAAGRPHTSVVRRNGRTEEGRAVQFDVVETYAPITRAGRVVGVFEIYYDFTARTAAMNSLIERANRTMLLMAALLLAAVAFASWRAVRAVRESERALHESERAAAALREQRDRPE